MGTREPLRDREVLRYRKRPRIVHAMLASSFLLMLFTGLVILWPALSGLAAGGWTRWLHRVGAVIFMAVPFVYWFADREGAKELMIDSFKYDRDDYRWLKRFWSYAFGHTANMPKQGRLNAGQKMHHALVMLLSDRLWHRASSCGSSCLRWARACRRGWSSSMTFRCWR